MINLLRNKVIIVPAVLLLLALISPFVPPFILLLIIQVLIFGILALSVDLLLGYTGLPSLGQAA